VVFITTLLGYLILAGFSLLEGRLRRGQDAKSFQAGQFDQRTTRFLGLAYFISAIGLLASWPLNFIGIGVLSPRVGWLGILVALFGLSMRIWANRVLGVFYTRTLRVSENQIIVREGPYHLIRHPGYLGMILTWSGIAVATANWIVILIVLAVTVSAYYYYRIENEERMLLTVHADYSEYRSHTWRLIPLIY
jgi:protein-S-isoprenylcysteine O-methyltransferase Ste14